MKKYQYLGAYIEKAAHGGWWCTTNWDYECNGNPHWFETEREAQQHAEVYA